MFFDEKIRLLSLYHRPLANGSGDYFPADPALQAFFDRVADEIVRRIAPKSVLDVGCGRGDLVRSLRNRGVQAFGARISAVPLENIGEDVRPYCWDDLETAFDQQETYDLIVSIESLAFVDESQAEAILSACAQHGMDILLSVVPFDFGDEFAFSNTHPPDHWAVLMSRLGFVHDVEFDASFVLPWAMRFRRLDASPQQIVAVYEHKLWLLQQEAQARRAVSIDAYNQIMFIAKEIAALENRLEYMRRQYKDLENRFNEVINSRSWQLIQRVQRWRERFIPINSRREDALYTMFRAIRVMRREGIRGVGSRILERVLFRWQIFSGNLRYRLRPANASRMVQIPPVSEQPPDDHLPDDAFVDIVVCVHNALDDVRRCLDSVVQHTTVPYKFVLVDDGSAKETEEFLKSFASQHDCVLVRNEKAGGYTRAANRGLQQTSADYIVLLNSDTIVTRGWLRRMLTCLESDAKIGLVGPLSNTASWQSIPEMISGGDWAENPLPEGITVQKMGELVAESSARLYPEMTFLNGFCILLRRAVVNEIGYFDEKSFPQGYGEENDYCLRARDAGWKLALADDTYIYHAQSRSYNHERRRKLSQQSAVVLAEKHGQHRIDKGVLYLRTNRVLEGIRARSRYMFDRHRIVQNGMRYADRRVLFVVPVRHAGGGSNIIMMEARAMRKMGVDVQILNLRGHRETFDAAYAHMELPVFYAEIDDIPRIAARYDAVVATFNPTVSWIKPALEQNPELVVGYYVQDFEPLFYPPDSEGYHMAFASYTLIPDMVRFSKTEWTRQQVETQIGVPCQVIGPSMDVDLFRPRPRKSEWPHRPLRVGAMIRPASLHRAPQLTLRILRRLAKKYGARVEIVLFGTPVLSPASGNDLPIDFPWQLAGILSPAQVANYMNGLDIFVDFSSHQAMGLTAMEAMACGVASILPQAGGASAFARHEENCLMVDTADPEACWEGLVRLVDDHDLRTRLQLAGLRDMPQYFPERPAFEILKQLFGG